MVTCAFFGHADAPKEIEQIIKQTVIELITKNNVDTFYVGTHGNFDAMAYNVLKNLAEAYPIKFFVVLPCVPQSGKKYEGYINTIVPEGVESVPPRFGIEYRNRWMVNNSDYVVTYVTRSFGGAYKFKEYALKRKKIIINIFDKTCKVI